MEPLTADDLLGLDEFAARRREFFAAHVRYLDRYRRVRLGPALTLIFENRQTLWFRVQEVIRVARLNDPVRIRQELDIYNRLLPSRDQLQAALLIQVDESRMVESLEPWRMLRGDQLILQIGTVRYPSNLLTCRPEDHCIGAAHWVQFVLDSQGRDALSRPQVGVQFTIRLPEYVHDSGLLSEEVRASLIEDLTFSTRAA